MNYSENHRMEIAITPTAGAAGTSAINGASCDCQRVDGVLVAVQMGAIVATAVTSIKLQGSDDNSTWADLEGTSQSIADDADDKLFYIDLYRPVHRYNRVVVSRGTANATVSAAVYHKYCMGKVPVSQGTNVSGELHISSDEGTA